MSLQISSFRLSLVVLVELELVTLKIEWFKASHMSSLALVVISTVY